MDMLVTMDTGAANGGSNGTATPRSGGRLPASWRLALTAKLTNWCSHRRGRGTLPDQDER